LPLFALISSTMEPERPSSYSIHIVSKYGTVKKAILKIEETADYTTEPTLIWRSKPMLSAKFSFVRYISEPTTSPLSADFDRFSIQINIVEITIEVSKKSSSILHTYLKDMLKKAIKINSLDKALKSSRQMQLFRNIATEATLKEEQLHEMQHHLKVKEAYIVLTRTLDRYRSKLLGSALSFWVEHVREENLSRMHRDRHRWRLHAAANQEIDLQAWYHALFYQEVYRLRGKFFYKDAILPVYRQSYDLVDNALTPLEEAALAHVLCSPDTTYGDVAGQMFVVQAILPAPQYELFTELAAKGLTVTKHPRQGRPAKKLFRFSFVEGNIYLTWKGKFGNQGVGMSEVTEVVDGIQTDVLKWSGAAAKSDQYLSVLCADRSIDLFFDSVQDRDNWRDVLQALFEKEMNKLTNIPGVEPTGPDVTDFDWLVLYTSIGKTMPGTNVP